MSKTNDDGTKHSSLKSPAKGLRHIDDIAIDYGRKYRTDTEHDSPETGDTPGVAIQTSQCCTEYRLNPSEKTDYYTVKAIVLILTVKV